MKEPSHADLLAELRVQGTKLTAIHDDVGEIKDTLKDNTSRLSGVEAWIQSHDTVVRFIKWGLAIIVGAAAPIVALVIYFKSRS